jgi:hypothetical protein
MKPASALKSVNQVINTAKALTLPLRGGEEWGSAGRRFKQFIKNYLELAF